jgi:hypothetical protein
LDEIACGNFIGHCSVGREQLFVRPKLPCGNFGAWFLLAARAGGAFGALA